jgi:hypothetical protein
MTEGESRGSHAGKVITLSHRVMTLPRTGLSLIYSVMSAGW